MQTLQGTSFWQALRNQLFVVKDYQWEETLKQLPQTLSQYEITTHLQDTQQILASNLRGRFLVGGDFVYTAFQADSMPESFRIEELLTLQWLYRFYIFEGMCQTFRDAPLPAWRDLCEPDLKFMVYIAGLLWLLEDRRLPENSIRITELRSYRYIVQEALQEITTTILTKGAEYGASYRHDGLPGLAPRIWDKIARYVELSALGTEGWYEPKVDAVKDLFGYCIIAWGLVREGV